MGAWRIGTEFEAFRNVCIGEGNYEGVRGRVQVGYCARVIRRVIQFWGNNAMFFFSAYDVSEEHSRLIAYSSMFASIKDETNPLRYISPSGHFLLLRVPVQSRFWSGYMWYIHVVKPRIESPRNQKQRIFTPILNEVVPTIHLILER